VAICDLNINDEFAINGITLNKSKKDGGYFLGFPSKVVKRRDAESKTDAKEYTDISHPLTAEARKEATDLAVEEWDRKFGNGGDEQP
jgi:DNA-binding cell septation regulator SpoVG